MSSTEPIGGYFGLEGVKGAYPHADALHLNSGRACIEYVLRAAGDVRRVHVPRYICEAVLEPLARLGIEPVPFPITDNLEPDLLPSPADGEMVLLANYFGLKDDFCRNAAVRYEDRLILDCAQAWYCEPPAGCHAFYSPRKFLGLPDGGLLSSPLAATLAIEPSQSWERASHLLIRADLGAEQGFAHYQRNEARFAGEGMRAMSGLTRNLLASFDHEGARRQRQENYATLHAALGGRNAFEAPDAPHGALAYPYRDGRPGLRDRLIGARIFVPTYWPGVEGEAERRLADELLPLPIDHRYGPQHMQRIVEALQ